MRRNHGREIQLKRREMAFPWISAGGNYGMRRNHGREIQLDHRKMAFSWISVEEITGCGGTMGGKSS